MVQDHVVQKLKRWKEKILLQAGKEILIRLVVQSILTNIMSCFKLPSDLCEEGFL